MAIDPKNQNNIDETSAYIKSTLQSVAAQIGEALQIAVSEAFDGADASVIKSLGADLTRNFKAAARFSDSIASNNYKISQGLLSSKDIEKQTQDLHIKRESLQRKYDALLEQAKDSNTESLEKTKEANLAAQEALKIQEALLDADKKRVETIEKNMGSMGELFSRFAKNNFFGSILNAEKGLVAMRKAAAEGTKGFALMGKGIKAAFQGIEKGSIILLIIKKIADFIKFFKDLAFGVSEQATNLARALGSSKDAAFKLRQQFEVIATKAEGTLYNVRNFIKSVEELKSEFGFVKSYTEDILKTQTLLTTRVKASAEVASFFNVMVKATGQNAEQAFESFNKIGIKLQEVDGIGVDVKTVLEDVKNAGAETASYYGYSTDALAQAAIAARKLGLNLTATKSVAQGLLDFESSINAQLELSVLTQKQFNFGTAMAKAAMGDTVGATQDVIKQMNQLTAEQRKSPIILGAMAKATGLSTEELAHQYALQYDINAQKKEYGRILAAEGVVEARNYLIRTGINQAEVKEIENRISAGEQFSEAMDQAKDALARLVNGGMLDRLILALTGVVEYLEDSWLFSPSEEAKLESKIAEFQRSDDEELRKTAAMLLEDQKKLKEQNALTLKTFDEREAAGFNRGSIKDGTRVPRWEVENTNEKRMEALVRRQSEILESLSYKLEESKNVSVNIDGSKVDSVLTSNSSKMRSGANFK